MEILLTLLPVSLIVAQHVITEIRDSRVHAGDPCVRCDA
jgi:hypothetical protein